MQVYGFTRSIKALNNKLRVSECSYSGTIDDDGGFKPTGCIGRIYHAENIKTANGGIREELKDMSIKSQQANMKTIHSLVSRDLSYCYGEREDGFNGAKKQFHSKAKAFLRTLGNDLGFTEFKVTNNHGGIAVSGEITLMGMWSEGNGLYLQLFQSLTSRQEFMYRHITHMKDYSGGRNQWLSGDLFAVGDYERLVRTLSVLRETTEVERRAA